MDKGLPPLLYYLHRRFAIYGAVALQAVSVGGVHVLSMFTPKFWKKNVGTLSFQDCVNQGINCIRIDIS